MRTTWILGWVIALAGAAGAQEQADPRKAEILNKLNTQRVSMDFKEASLEDVVDFLRDFSGINFHVDPDIRERVGGEPVRITIKVKDLLLKSALKLMLSSRDLSAVYRDGIVIIQHKDQGAAEVKVVVYDVRDLLFKLEDFPGPTVELKPNGVGPDIVFVIEDPKPAITEEFIVDIVKSHTGDRSWEENPKASVDLANGLLVVTQTQKVHGEIRRLLDLLRQFK
ncbi:MAG: hypothetical protein HYY16_13055 [Planctomycetes bacterium]|nr:hypothetical protein [Planctomycetota bacterium]